MYVHVLISLSDLFETQYVYVHTQHVQFLSQSGYKDVVKSDLRNLQAAQRPMANPKKMRWSKAKSK